jgi:hypothetical protein
MIGQTTVESQLKYIHDEVGGFKTAQPFFNGQFDMKLITSVVSYDATVTLASVADNIFGQAVFLSENQAYPFCTMYAVLMRTVGVPETVVTLTEGYARRAAVNPPKEVRYTWMFIPNGIASGTVYYVKLYAVTSDYGTILPNL